MSVSCVPSRTIDTPHEITLSLKKCVGAKPRILEFIKGEAWLLEGILTEDECEKIIVECEKYHADVQYGLSYCTKSCFDDPIMALRIQERINECFTNYEENVADLATLVFIFSFIISKYSISLHTL